MRGQMGGITAEALFLCQKQTLKSKATAKGSLQWSSRTDWFRTDHVKGQWGRLNLLKGWAQRAMISGTESLRPPEVPANLSDAVKHLLEMSQGWSAGKPTATEQTPPLMWFRIISLGFAHHEQERNVSITSFNLHYIKTQDYFHATWQLPCQLFQRLLAFTIIHNFIFLQIILLLFQDYQTDRYPTFMREVKG